MCIRDRAHAHRGRPHAEALSAAGALTRKGDHRALTVAVLQQHQGRMSRLCAPSTSARTTVAPTLVMATGRGADRARADHGDVGMSRVLVSGFPSRCAGDLS